MLSLVLLTRDINECVSRSLLLVCPRSCRRHPSFSQLADCAHNKVSTISCTNRLRAIRRATSLVLRLRLRGPVATLPAPPWGRSCHASAACHQGGSISWPGSPPAPVDHHDHHHHHHHVTIIIASSTMASGWYLPHMSLHLLPIAFAPPAIMR